jgi:TetR/AcrR family transcriptional regulator, tetracycline repressor protein
VPGRAAPRKGGRGGSDEPSAGADVRASGTVPGTAGSRRLRPGLSRSVVLEAAIDYVDQFGLAELSMRKLGASLQVEGMALYRYVHSRDELLDAMVDRLMDQLYADPQVLLAPADDWQTFLHKVADGVRRLALDHPQIFPLVATRHRAAPWIRPPLRSLRWIEGFLAALLSRGFSEDAAVYAYRAFGSFLVGHLLLEVSAEGADPVTASRGGDGGTEDGRPPLDLTAYPTLTRLADRLAVDDMHEEFEHSLGNLIERLDEARTRLS